MPAPAGSPAGSWPSSAAAPPPASQSRASSPRRTRGWRHSCTVDIRSSGNFQPKVNKALVGAKRSVTNHGTFDSLSERLRVGCCPVIGGEGSRDCGCHPDPDLSI